MKFNNRQNSCILLAMEKQWEKLKKPIVIVLCKATGPALEAMRISKG